MSEASSLQNDNVLSLRAESPFKPKHVDSFLDVLKVGIIYERLIYLEQKPAGHNLVLFLNNTETHEVAFFSIDSYLPDPYFRIDQAGRVLAVRKPIPIRKEPDQL